MPTICRPRPVRTHRRRGIVSIWAIVCLILVTVIGATLGRTAIMGSRHMIQERRRAQADWLQHAGWSLAISQVERNPDYRGETWEIPAAELGGADAGRVQIEVTSPAEGTVSTQRQISVVAEFPAGSDHKVQVSRVGTWTLPAAP